MHGRYEAAADHWQQALELYTQVGVPDADRVRTRLTGVV